MINYSRLGYEIKRDFTNFSQEISKGLKRPQQKFVHQMIYGILAGNKLHLSEIARSLKENITLKKTRLARQKRIGASATSPWSWMHIRRVSLVKRTTAACSTAARLRVVSKCAFSVTCKEKGASRSTPDAPHRRSPAGLSPPFQLAPVLPQTNRSHIYLVAETTLYIVTLRKESLNPTPNRTGLRIWNGTRTTVFPGRISKDPASSPCLPTLKRGLWERSL